MTDLHEPKMLSRVLMVVEPPERTPFTEWADQDRVLTGETSARRASGIRCVSDRAARHHRVGIAV